MTSPADRTTVHSRVQADPWVERDVGPLPRTDRLHAEQPEAGLLWVLAGKVVVQHEERTRDVRPGTVVSYRLGQPLSWSAPEGALVRWSGRPVKLAAGEVASWTANLAVDVPPAEAEAPPAERKRRGIYATAAIAATWLVALTVAWCYHEAQSGQEIGAARPSAPATPTPGALSTEERASRARAAEAIFAQAGHVEATAFVPGGRAHNVDVSVPVPPSDEIPAADFEAAARAALERWTDFQAVRVVLVDGDVRWAQVTYKRDSAIPRDLRDGR